MIKKSPFLLLAILTVCNLRNFFKGEHIVKQDNKKPVRTSLKYDEEIKDEVGTEGRELSDQICQQTWRRKYYEGNFLKSRDWKIRPLEYLENSQDARMNLSRLFTVTITGQQYEERRRKLLQKFMIPWLTGQQKRKIVYQICQPRRRYKRQLRINTRFVQRHGNGVDCGLFAIAFAVSLHLEKKLLETNSMRSHLSE